MVSKSYRVWDKEEEVWNGSKGVRVSTKIGMGKCKIERWGTHLEEREREKPLHCTVCVTVVTCHLGLGLLHGHGLALFVPFDPSKF